MNNTPLVFRELTGPVEVTRMLRLRHWRYFEHQRYGSAKPLGVDLTAYDHRARFFGVFQGEELLGGMRLVFRDEQQLALIVRTLRALAGGEISEASNDALPSEEAFDLKSTLGLRCRLVDVEVGRFVMTPEAAPPRVAHQMLIATLSVLLLVRARYYLYSCAIAMAKRYAVAANPRWTLEGRPDSGIHADGFVFPKLSCAGVASPEESPYLEQALTYAAELAETGRIVFSVARPSCSPGGDAVDPGRGRL